METLADVVRAGRDREGAAVDAPDRQTPYSYAEFSTNAWKAGNLLRHYGVRPAARLALIVGPKDPAPDDEPGRLGTAADPLLGLLGGAALGATVDLTPAQPVDARAFVLPNAWVDEYEVAPGCSLVAYGGPPEAAEVAHFERELWSENPIEPPDPVEPADTLLQVDGETYTHAQLLESGQSVVDEYALEDGDRVLVDAPLTTAGAIAAGVVAPLAAGATIVPRTDETIPEDVVYAVGAGGGDVPVVDPTAVLD